MIVLVRIDDRLIHGQVIVSWIPFTKANVIIVADNNVYEDKIQKKLFELAVPPYLKVFILPIKELAEKIKQLQNDRIMLLFSTPKNLLESIQYGVEITKINLGLMSYKEGKRQICPNIFIDKKDEEILNNFHQQGIEIEIKAVPTDPKIDIMKYINKN